VTDILGASQSTVSVLRRPTLHLSEDVRNFRALTIGTRPIDAGQEIFQNVSGQGGAQGTLDNGQNISSPNVIDWDQLIVHTCCSY